MKNKNKNEGGFLFFLLVSLLLAGFFGFVRACYAENNHIIINQIQASGKSANDEWIELYNPTDVSIDIAGWSIQYRGGSGVTYYKKNFEAGSIIPAKHFFLIAHGGTGNYAGATALDMTWSQSLSSIGGTIFLVNNQTLLLDGASAFVVDRVSYGSGVYLVPENLPAVKPENNQSVTRKDFQDTDNNNFDFNLPSAPTPHNSSFASDDSEEKIICNGNSSNIKINEIYPNTEDENDEFVEITNNIEGCVNVSGWKIMDDANHQSTFPENSLLDAGGYLYLQKKLYLNNDADIVYLLNKDGLEIDRKEYKEASRAQSYSFAGTDWQWTSIPTPGAKNEFNLSAEAPEDTDNEVFGKYAIYLNEVLPNPKGTDSEGEFIEFYNSGATTENLENWILKDKNGNAHILQKIDGVSLEIKSIGYLIINPNDYGASLHNTVDEDMALLDPKGALVSSFSYKGQGIKEDVSYNFDGTDWHWSRFLTPSEENKFNNPPEVSKKKKNKIYAGMYADFSAKGSDADKDELKFTWDFGDGHKSYLKKTRHIYEKFGKYTITLKVSDGSEDKIETFNIKVEKFPKSKIEILSVSPNPKGKDSDSEFITLQNESKKKINLKDWSVATGSKNLYNHPITEDLVVKPGETITLTRNFSKFALNNKKAKVELRYPNGKIASRLAYDKKKESVTEDELYTKESGAWAWIVPKTETKLAVADSIPNPTPLPIEKEKAEIEIAKEDAVIKEITPDSEGIVAGASVEEKMEPPQPQKNSYVIRLFDALNLTINYFLYKIIALFS